MSKPRYNWWGYIRAVIRNYPGHHEDLYDSKLQSVTASYSAMPRGGGAGRGVENLAIRTLPMDEQKEYDAVLGAAREVMRQFTNGAERLKLIDMVFWSQTYTLQGAAQQIPVSYETAKRWQRDFIIRVAKRMDIFHPEEKNNHKSQKSVLN